MHFSKLVIAAVPAVACLVSLVQGFDPITLTVGTTAFVLSGTQVGLAVASLAGLAIVKEKLAISALSRRRGRRDVGDVEQVDLAPFFNAIAAADASDCGKLLVCSIMAKPAGERTQEESRVASLFDDLAVIDPSSSYANYQLAALVGQLGHQRLCTERYARCPVTVDGLDAILEAHN